MLARSTCRDGRSDKRSSDKRSNVAQMAAHHIIQTFVIPCESLIYNAISRTHTVDFKIPRLNSAEATLPR